MRLLLALIFAALPVAVLAEAPVVKELSANGGKFQAFVLPVDQEDRIVVRRHEPRDIAELSLLSPDSQHGGHVEKIQWAPKGKYLIFSTSSSGGHSPWHFKTYIFSTERWEFLVLDEAVAAVTSPEFTMPDPGHLSVEMLKTQSSPAEETALRVLDMEALPWKSPKRQEREE